MRCKIYGCEKDAKAVGMCPMHYYRVKKYGSSDKPKNIPVKWLDEHLWHEGSECLLWPYSRNIEGYALISVKSKSKSASRYVCEKTNGKPPKGNPNCLHSCGNGHLGCVNRNHLYWGNQLQNNLDRINHAISKGKPASGRAKISTECAISILGKHRDGKKQSEIAAEYNVSKYLVSDLVRRKTWAHLSVNEGE